MERVACYTYVCSLPVTYALSEAGRCIVYMYDDPLVFTLFGAVCVFHVSCEIQTLDDGSHAVTALTPLRPVLSRTKPALTPSPIHPLALTPG